MENFIAYNPTKVHFGRNVVEELGTAAMELGKKVLLVYGKGSALKNGSYDLTKQQLIKTGAEVIEYSGIKPNPLVADVDKAAQTGIENNCDLIVAVGGGSVIDSAKIIGICIAVLLIFLTPFFRFVIELASWTDNQVWRLFH